MRYCLGPPDSYGPIWAALGFMPFGLFFDFMDGKVARWRGKSSLMGQELDSLADLVCEISIPTISESIGFTCVHRKEKELVHQETRSSVVCSFFEAPTMTRISPQLLLLLPPQDANT